MERQRPYEKSQLRGRLDSFFARGVMEIGSGLKNLLWKLNFSGSDTRYICKVIPFSEPGVDGSNDPKLYKQ